MKRLILWVFSPVMLRRYLYASIILILLIAAFYIEENWRGAREWEAVKAKLEAQGETFDIAAYIPPPVPDEENFCATPLLARLFEFKTDPKTGEKTSIGLEQIKAMRREDATLKTQEKRPRGGDYRLGQKLDLNQWRDYYLSNPAFAEAHPSATANEAIAAHFNAHAAEWKELEVASTRKYTRFPVDYLYQPFWKGKLPQLDAVWHLTGAIKVKAANEFASGKVEQALASLRVALKLQQALSHEPLMISQSTNNSAAMSYLQPVWEALQERKLSRDDLEELLKQLNSIHLLDDYERGLRSEIHFIIRNLDYLKSVQSKKLYFFPGWHSRNKVTGVKYIYGHFLPAIDPQKHRVDVSAIKREEKAIQEKDKYLLVRFYNGFFIYLCGITEFPQRLLTFSQSQTYIDMAIIACHLEKYCLAYHEYPESLGKLNQSLPHDLITGEPYHYQRTTEGRYKLWSVGWNQKDDGGVRAVKSVVDPAVSHKSKPHLDNEEGDWVWSYTP